MVRAALLLGGSFILALTPVLAPLHELGHAAYAWLGGASSIKIHWTHVTTGHAADLQTVAGGFWFEFGFWSLLMIIGAVTDSVRLHRNRVPRVLLLPVSAGSLLGGGFFMTLSTDYSLLASMVGRTEALKVYTIPYTLIAAACVLSFMILIGRKSVWIAQLTK